MVHIRLTERHYSRLCWEPNWWTFQSPDIRSDKVHPVCNQELGRLFSHYGTGTLEASLSENIHENTISSVTTVFGFGSIKINGSSATTNKLQHFPQNKSVQIFYSIESLGKTQLKGTPVYPYHENQNISCLNSVSIQL